MGNTVKKDIALPANISLYQSQLSFIDKYRISRSRFKDRSKYIQSLVEKDIKYRRMDFFAEFMGLLILPMMGFFFFLVLSVLTAGLLFYFMMIIFGLFAVVLSVAYFQKNRMGRSE